MVTVARVGSLSFMAPLGIGIALFAASSVGIGFTGASMNPVRSLAPCAINHNFPDYHWVYWVGPMLGALLPGIYVRLMKVLMWPNATNRRSGEGETDRSGDTDIGAVEERLKMLPEAPTPPKIRKTTVTEVTSELSPGARSGNTDTYFDKEDVRGAYYPGGISPSSRSPHRSSREARRLSSGRYSGSKHLSDANSPSRSPPRSSREERRFSSGRNSDMTRYSRAREYEDVMR